jgi:5-methylcytosine-specific restriction endonuclease McrA
MPAPLLKPSALERHVAKWEAKLRKQTTKKAKKQQADKCRAAFTALIWARDGGRCRVCGAVVKKASQGGDPRLHGHVHEIVYRSARGRQEPENAVLVCGLDHDREHRHLISITGTHSALSVELEVPQ